MAGWRLAVAGTCCCAGEGGACGAAGWRLRGRRLAPGRAARYAPTGLLSRPVFGLPPLPLASPLLPAGAVPRRAAHPGSAGLLNRLASGSPPLPPSCHPCCRPQVQYPDALPTMALDLSNIRVVAAFLSKARGLLC